MNFGFVDTCYLSEVSGPMLMPSYGSPSFWLPRSQRAGPRKRRGVRERISGHSKCVAQESRRTHSVAAITPSIESAQPGSLEANGQACTDDSISLDDLYLISPFDILEAPAMCKALLNKLEADESTTKELIEYLLPAIKDLALHVEGSRVVQNILNSGGPHVLKVVPHLVDIFEELYQSQNGNYVLTKAFQLPSASLVGMIRKVEGRATTVARHCYGCRVLERFIEHFTELQLSCLLQEIVVDAESLCRHPYGNFVIQHMLEHDSQGSRREMILQAMLTGGMPYLASHRTASHVVQKALDTCDTAGQHQIVEALLLGQGDDSLLRVATSRYGSYVIEHLKGLKDSCSGLVSVVETRLRDSQEALCSTPNGCRVAQRFGLKDLQAAADMVPGGDVFE